MHCDMLKIQDGGAIVEKLNLYNDRLAPSLTRMSFDKVYPVYYGIRFELSF